MSKKLKKIYMFLSTLVFGATLFLNTFLMASVPAYANDNVTIRPAVTEVVTNITNPKNTDMHKPQCRYTDAGNTLYGHSHRQRMDKIKYIVIHSTENPNATAMQHCRYLNSNSKSVAANYYVDNEEIVNTVDDDVVAYHAGSMAINECSIGIEICEFTDKEKQLKAIQNTSYLVQQLLEKYPGCEIITHHDVTGKLCPSLVYNDRPIINRSDLIAILRGE